MSVHNINSDLFVIGSGTFTSLAGAGNRMVTVNSLGELIASPLTPGTITNIILGQGLTGTNPITTTGTISLGTPSSVSLSSTNSLTSNSHTHKFEPGGTSSQYIRGDGTLDTFPTLPTDYIHDRYLITSWDDANLDGNSKIVTSALGSPTSQNSNGIFIAHGGQGTLYGTEIAARLNRLFWRSLENGTWRDWREAASIDSYTLQTVTDNGSTTTRDITTGSIAINGNASATAPTGSNLIYLGANGNGSFIQIRTNTNTVSATLRSYALPASNNEQLTLSSGGIYANGGAQFSGLAGTGTRMVVTSSDGTLSTQSIPTSANNGTLTISTSGIATGGTTFTANQSSNSTVNISVPGTNLGGSFDSSTGILTVTSSTGSNANITMSGFIGNKDNGYEYGTYDYIKWNGWDTDGGLATKIVEDSSSGVDYYIEETERTIIFFDLAASITCYLPDPTKTSPGRELIISNDNLTGVPVILDGIFRRSTGGVEINSQETWYLQNDGTYWHILFASNIPS